MTRSGLPFFLTAILPAFLDERVRTSPANNHDTRHWPLATFLAGLTSEGSADYGRERMNGPAGPRCNGNPMMKTILPNLSGRLSLAAAAAFLAATPESPAQTPAATNLPVAGLVLHYEFNEAPTNCVVVDSSGRGNAGRIAGAGWVEKGRVGGGCEFGATEQFIVAPGSPSLSSKQVTFMVWIRAAVDVTGKTLLDRNSEKGYALTIGEGTKGGMRGKAMAYVAGHSCASDNAVADNFWHHLAATYDGEKLTLYVDGAAQKQTSVWKGEAGAPGTELTIGMNRSNPEPAAKGVSYEGVLDEVRIYDRALAGTDVTAIFSATKPKFSKNEVSRRIAELKELKDRGLLLDDFFARKMKECEQ